MIAMSCPDIISGSVDNLKKQVCSTMLSHFLKRTPHLLTHLRYHCVYHDNRTAILQSQYHKNGPFQTKIPRKIEQLLAGQLAPIRQLQQELNVKREEILKKVQEKKKMETAKDNVVSQEYFGTYQELMKRVEKCPLNNEWIYRLISHYNMRPFYKNLIQRLIEGGPQEITTVVDCLSSMEQKWDNPYGIIDQSLFKQQNISNFFKRLQKYQFDIRTLRQIEALLPIPVNFAKRRFYLRYFNRNIQSWLKYIQVSDNYNLCDLIWLLYTYIKNMNDDDSSISKLQKYIVTQHPVLDSQDVTHLMRAYELKGTINQDIYFQYIKPYILKNQMSTIQGLIDSIKFTICAQTNDNTLLKQLYQLVSVQYGSTKISSSRHAYTLHLYTHYLQIKGYKIKLPAQLEKELISFCKQRAEGRENVYQIVTQLKYQDKNMKKKYKSACLNVKPGVREFEQTPKSVFEQEFGHKLRDLQLRDYHIFQKPVFCCFELDYCLVHRQKQEVVDVQVDGIQYVFGSGRLIRERIIRDQILEHYNLKVNHIDYNFVRTKNTFDQDEILMNKRVTH